MTKACLARSQYVLYHFISLTDFLRSYYIPHVKGAAYVCFVKDRATQKRTVGHYNIILNAYNIDYLQTRRDTFELEGGIKIIVTPFKNGEYRVCGMLLNTIVFDCTGLKNEKDLNEVKRVRTMVLPALSCVRDSKFHIYF